MPTLRAVLFGALRRFEFVVSLPVRSEDEGFILPELFDVDGVGNFVLTLKLKFESIGRLVFLSVLTLAKFALTFLFAGELFAFDEVEVMFADELFTLALDEEAV